MEGLVIVGYLLTSNLCRLDGLKPVDCRATTPVRFSLKTDCELALVNILDSFPRMEPEQLGFPKGSRLQVNGLRCRPLYGEIEA